MGRFAEWGGHKSTSTGMATEHHREIWEHLEASQVKWVPEKSFYCVVLRALGSVPPSEFGEAGNNRLEDAGDLGLLLDVIEFEDL